MEIAMIRDNVMEDDEQTLARLLNGLNHPINKIADFQPYSNLIELVHQARQAPSSVSLAAAEATSPMNSQTSAP